MSQDPAVLRLTTNAQEKAQLLVDPQQLNTYAYARNNPVRHTDPSGEVLPLVAGAVYYGGVALTAWGAYDIASEGVDAYNTGGVAAGLITVGKTAAIEATVGKATKGVRIGKMLGSIGEKVRSVLGKKSFGDTFIKSEHALERLKKWNISEKQLNNTLKQKSFHYVQNGVKQKGYYDAKNKIFTAVSKEGKIITVIKNTSKKYIKNVKKRK